MTKKISLTNKIKSWAFGVVLYTSWFTGFVLFAIPYWLGVDLYPLCQFISSSFVIFILKLLGVRIKVQGRFPNHRMIVASNHMHTVEICLLLTLKYINSTWVIAPFHHSLGLSGFWKKLADIYDRAFQPDRIIVPAGEDRGRLDGLKGFLSRVKHECITKRKSLFIFPEGKRVAVGERVEYHTTPAMLARFLKFPVLPVSVNTGYVAYGPKSIYLDFNKTVHVKVHEPMDYEETVFRLVYEANQVEGDVDHMQLEECKLVLKHLGVKHNLGTDVVEIATVPFATELRRGYHVLHSVYPSLTTRERDQLFIDELRRVIESGIVPV